MWVFSALFRGGRTIATSMYGLAIRNTVVFISSKFMKIMHKNENNLITQGSFRKYYRKCHFLFYVEIRLRRVGFPRQLWVS